MEISADAQIAMDKRVFSRAAESATDKSLSSSSPAAVAAIVEELKTLLAAGANPDGHRDSAGRTALIVAAGGNAGGGSGSAEVVKTLLRLGGAEKDARSHSGETALMEV